MVLKVCNQSYPAENKYSSYFEKYGFPLSDFQKYAIEGIVEKHHVLVTAHTGSGKTLPAEFAIEHLVSQKKKVIYTSPIKALSNQKFSEFTRKYPHISFGLLTGDIKTNPEADVLIMTTEILMNYLFIQTTANAEEKDNTQLHFQIDLEEELGAVVFDEVHYINDADRGQTWEKTILMLPHHVQMVMLSATIDAPQKFAQWIMRGNDSKDVYLASTNKRVVPLTHYGFWSVNEGGLKTLNDKVLVKDIKDHSNKLLCLQTDKGVFQEDNYKDLKRMAKIANDKKLTIKRKQVLNNVCKFMKNNNMLPAIGFVFSRKLVEICASEITVPLFNEGEQESYNIAKECEHIVRKLPNYKEYMELPEYRNLVSLLEKGIGIHHSGMIPILREIVEIMISKKYIYLLFATESFAIGLDCPIKTAMFISLTKFDGHHERLLMGHEYTQMAGRAGRRGIDTIGHVIHLNNLFTMPMQSEYQTILKGKPQTLVSKFRISYSLVFNLLKNGKNKKEDFHEFVGNSMVHNEITNSLQTQKQMVAQLENEINQHRNRMLPYQEKQDIQEFMNLEESMRGKLSNNKRRNCETKIEQLKKTNSLVKEYITMKQEQELGNIKLEKDKHHLHYLEHFVENSLDNLLNVLLKTQFIEGVEQREYELSRLGKMASNIAEVHPVIMSLIMDKYAMFEEMSLEQIIGLLAVFCDVNVDRDVKKIYPCSDNAYLKEVLYQVENWTREWEDMENVENLNCGYDYESMLNFNMPDLAILWMKCENEGQCKSFLETIKQEYGISVGDFTKAMLKIATIGRELGAIAETVGNMDSLQSLKQIDVHILKFITTNQSLYV